MTKNELTFTSNKYGTWTSNQVNEQVFIIEVIGNIYHIFRNDVWTGISFRSLNKAVDWCRDTV